MFAALGVFFGIVAQAAGGAGTSPAQSKAKAQILLSNGSALYERGDFAAALEKFRAAFALYRSPKLFFNMGQAYRDLGRPLEAREAFNHFVMEAVDAPANMVAEARRALTDVESKLGRAYVTSPLQGAEISIDGQIIGTVPILAPVWLLPGEHQVVARHHPGAKELTQFILVAAGQSVNVPIEMVPRAEATLAPTPERPGPSLVTPAIASQSLPPATATPVQQPEPTATSALQVSLQAPAPTPPTRESGRTPLPRWLPWVGAGVTLALGTGAIVAGVSADSRFDDLKSSCGQTAAGCTSDEMDSVRSRDRTANILWALAGVSAAATGITVYVNTRDAGIAGLVRF